MGRKKEKNRVNKFIYYSIIVSLIIEMIFVFTMFINVNTQCRILVYDILDLGEQFKTMGLLVITDAILNRFPKNTELYRRMTTKPNEKFE